MAQPLVSTHLSAMATTAPVRRAGIWCSPGVTGACAPLTRISTPRVAALIFRVERSADQRLPMLPPVHPPRSPALHRAATVVIRLEDSAETYRKARRALPQANGPRHPHFPSPTSEDIWHPLHRSHPSHGHTPRGHSSHAHACHHAERTRPIADNGRKSTTRVQAYFPGRWMVPSGTERARICGSTSCIEI
ncbi:hypothetical protein C8R47DRAFT_1086588 [Mycena vitilis]|nr:hypothetical protein C8R47DRAFT_1086588 [Mycena vitilis]